MYNSSIAVLLQAVHHCAAFPPVIVLLPLLHLVDQLQEGALGYRCVAVHRPAQELELLHHPVAVLRLEGKGDAQVIPG